MSCRKILPSLLIILFLPSGQAFAGLLFMGNLGFGGDKLASADGGQSLDGGSGIQLSIGYRHKITDGENPLSISATYGWKLDLISDDDGDATFTREAIDILGTVDVKENIKLSAGITQHTSVEYDIDTTSEDETILFDNSIGTVLQMGFFRELVDETVIEYGLRYTAIEYTANEVSEDLNGNNIAFYMMGEF